MPAFIVEYLWYTHHSCITNSPALKATHAAAARPRRGCVRAGLRGEDWHTRSRACPCWGGQILEGKIESVCKTQLRLPIKLKALFGLFSYKCKRSSVSDVRVCIKFIKRSCQTSLSPGYSPSTPGRRGRPVARLRALFVERTNTRPTPARINEQSRQQAFLATRAPSCRTYRPCHRGRYGDF